MLLGFREAAAREGVGRRTLERWRGEGMRVKRDGNRLLVDPMTVRAWKRWKSLKNVRHERRRRVAFAGGVSGALVTEAQRERVFREWVAAGGRPDEEKES